MNEAEDAAKRWYVAASPYATPEALKEALAEVETYKIALDRAAYAMFQLKRFAGMPLAAIDFCREEHAKACEVLNGIPAARDRFTSSSQEPGK